jgi:hypothetical protein
MSFIILCQVLATGHTEVAAGIAEADACRDLNLVAIGPNRG